MAEKEFDNENLERTNEDKPETKKVYKEVTSVLSPKLTAGPHGVGDPDDYSLRKVELNVLIPKRMKERAKDEKCRDQYRTLSYCAREHGMFVALKCKSEARKLERCLKHWINDEDFQRECKEQYLEDRRFYRATGISRKEMKIVDALLERHEKEKAKAQSNASSSGSFGGQGVPS